jgi:GntR family transcriptional regulator
MLGQDSSKPYYAQIKDYILYRINHGELAAHDRVPSERSLSEQFGVSRLTVSKALKELVLEGKLYTRVGKGTFVREMPINQSLDVLTSFSAEMGRRGQLPSSRVLEALTVPATETLSRRLNVPVGVSLVKLKRVRLASEQPIALETAYLIAGDCEGMLERFDFRHESLYRVLEQHYGLRLTRAEQEIEARLATAEEAEVLHLTGNSPVLSMLRVTFVDDARAVEYVESAYRGDRYKFRAHLLQMVQR